MLWHYLLYHYKGTVGFKFNGHGTYRKDHKKISNGYTLLIDIWVDLMAMLVLQCMLCNIEMKGNELMLCPC